MWQLMLMAMGTENQCVTVCRKSGTPHTSRPTWRGHNHLLACAALAQLGEHEAARQAALDSPTDASPERGRVCFRSPFPGDAGACKASLGQSRKRVTRVRRSIFARKKNPNNEMTQALDRLSAAVATAAAAAEQGRADALEFSPIVGVWGGWDALLLCLLLL